MSQSLDHLRPPSGSDESCSIVEPAPTLLQAPLVRPAAMPAIETVGVAIGAIAAARLIYAYGPTGLHWLLIPCTLVAAALLPTWIARREFPRVGLRAGCIGPAVRSVLLVCLCVLPPVYLGLWLLASSGVALPLRPVPATQQNWLAWLFYQFMYVAAAEEVFFRGYLQANAMRLLRDRGLSRPAQRWIAIAVAAGCFALAHVVVQGQIVSALTFLPGLLMGWLFARTQSLLAPILFHGLANVSYGILAAALA